MCDELQLLSKDRHNLLFVADGPTCGICIVINNLRGSSDWQAAGYVRVPYE